jgi:chromate reductase
MTTIVGICGNLRRGSFNGMLLRAAVESTPPGTVISSESIREIPLYDGDVAEQPGVPAVVERLKDGITLADGLLIVTPARRQEDMAHVHRGLHRRRAGYSA